MKSTLFKIISAGTITFGSLFVQAADKEYTIAGIVFQNDLFMRTVQIGMENAGKELGAKVLLGSSDNKIDKEAQLIDTYIARGVDAIVITPLSADGSVAALKRARTAGIEVVIFGTPLNDDLYVSFINSEQREIGGRAGDAAKQYIEENLNGEKIEVATLSFRSQIPEMADARSSSFLEKIIDDENVTLVSEQDAWLAEKAVTVAGDIITANPGLNIIHAANEGGTVGAVQAVKNAGKAGQIAVFGTDGSDQIAQMLLFNDGILQTSSAQQPFLIGKTGVQVAIDALNGKDVKKEIIVPVRLLERANPEDVKAFQKELRSYR